MSTGIPADEVPVLLRFLHEMGTVMWHDDEGLRDVVILDPVKYFVEPVTRLICKHSARDGTGHEHDSSTHHERWHDLCQDYDQRKWLDLVQKGVLYESILHILLDDTGRELMLTRLMLKIGLIVTFPQRGDDEVKYLVPALLPEADLANESDLTIAAPFSTCYIIFTIWSSIMQQECLTSENLQRDCFLPSGLFPRLVGKAAQLRNQSVRYRPTQHLFAQSAVLYYGSQRFKLTLLEKKNAIRLDVEGLHPVGVLNRLHNQITSIVTDCFRSLRFFVVLEYEGEGRSDSVFVNMQAVKEACADVTLKAGESRSIRVGGVNVSSSRLEVLYRPWVRKRELLEVYHAFFSYRWGRDSEFVTQCNDKLLEETIGSQHSAVEVFQDERRLQTGTDFLEGFEDALVVSLVVIPVMSRFALDRMIAHDPTKVDYTLLEWILACQCWCINRGVNFKHPSVRVERVLPILFEDIGPILVRMSDVVPTATWRKAEEALHKRNLTAAFGSCTVKALIQDHLMKLLWCDCSCRDVNFEPARTQLAAAVDTCTSAVHGILNELNVDQYSSERIQPQVAGGSMLPTPTTAIAAAATSAKSDEPTSSGNLAWGILTDRNRHQDPEALAGLLARLGIVNESSLMACDREIITQMANLMKEVSRKEFLKSVKDVQKAWDLLHTEGFIKDKEGLATFLENECITTAEDLAEVEDETLQQLSGHLKGLSVKKFKFAMKLV
jgi:hypothetical protein